MSYQVLARKWRPGNFDELVGQTHVLRALTSALDNERLHHAYLFTGTRGVGKTTIARILARCLNCDQGISSKPCGSCSACSEINEGRFVDLIEVDAASRTKVEDTRELLENVQYRPTRGRYKVYLIDEVHMLSTHSFNALLKTLEEPPPHVVFLLATTDPQKLPPTVLSRCLQFHLKNMQPEDIHQHLGYILTEESIHFEQPALESIAWSAKGSMRDALSLLDQAIAFGDGKVIETDVREMLGTIDRDHVYQLVSALAANDGASCMSIVEQLNQFSPEYDDVLAELLRVFHQIAVVQQIPDATLASQDEDKIKEFASTISSEDVQLFYQLALHGRRDLPLAPDKRSGFEMCLIRLMSFRPLSNKVTNKGATPVKKPESSNLTPATNAVDSSINKNAKEKVEETTEVQASSMPIEDEQPPLEIPEYLEQERAEQDHGIPESLPNSEPAKVADTENKTVAKSMPLGSALQSPLLRNQINSQSMQNETQPEKSSLDEQEDAEIQDNSASKNGEEFNAKNVSSVVTSEVISEVTNEVTNEAADTITNELPKSIDETHQTLTTEQEASEVIVEKGVEQLNKESWHLFVNKLSLTGVTEQILLNSQIISVSEGVIELSLANTIRTMLSNEHINKITTAINAQYKTDYTLSVANLEPDYETPRLRKQRLREERHQQACDDLKTDPQFQGLMKTFEAILDTEEVTALVPEGPL